MAKKYKANKSEAIRKLYDLGHDPKEIQTMTNYSKPLINVVLRNYKAKKKARKAKIVKAVTEVKQVSDKIDQRKTSDLVNSPPHYRTGGIDYWDFAEAKGLTENAYLFNAGKYIVRCGKKEGADPIQDLEKAIKFIQRDIDRRKNA